MKRQATKKEPKQQVRILKIPVRRQTPKNKHERTKEQAPKTTKKQAPETSKKQAPENTKKQAPQTKASGKSKSKKRNTIEEDSKDTNPKSVEGEPTKRCKIDEPESDEEFNEDDSDDEPDTQTLLNYKLTGLKPAKEKLGNRRKKKLGKEVQPQFILSSLRLRGKNHHIKGKHQKIKTYRITCLEIDGQRIAELLLTWIINTP